MMPKLDGISATRNIRQYDTWTPIISMTSNTTERDVNEYILSGMTDVLPKPLEAQTLRKLLERYCAHLKVVKQGYPGKRIGLITNGPSQTVDTGVAGEGRQPVISDQQQIFNMPMNIATSQFGFTGSIPLSYPSNSEIQPITTPPMVIPSSYIEPVHPPSVVPMNVPYVDDQQQQQNIRRWQVFVNTNSYPPPHHCPQPSLSELETPMPEAEHPSKRIRTANTQQ